MSESPKNVHVSSLSSTTEASEKGTPAVTMAPRYIPLLDVLYDLRQRFPSVVECVTLQCTRCHQWVAEDVHTRIPDEIAEAAVAVETSYAPVAVVAPSSTRARPSAEEAKQTAMCMPMQWHSERLRQKSADALRQQEKQREEPLSSEKEQVLLALLQKQPPVRTSSSPSPSSSGRKRIAGAGAHKAEEGDSTAAHVTHYMPNPATFVCRWACCAHGDRMRDLQRTWTGELLKIADELAAARDKLYVKKEEEETDKEAVKTKGRGDLVEKKGESMKPVNSASASPSSASSSLFPQLTPSSSSSSPDFKTRRDALNEALEKALEMRRSSRLAQRRACIDREARSSITTAALLSLLAPQTSATKSGGASAFSGVHSLTPPSPPPPPAATAATSSPTSKSHGVTCPDAEAKTRRQQWLHHAWVQSAANYLIHADRAATLSAFCWVVCDACGKVRRVAQPFPGGSPFVCALSPMSGGRCDVSEMDGFITCTEVLLGEQLVEAAQLSPFVDVVPPYRLTGPDMDEPILRSVCAVVEAELGAGADCPTTDREPDKSTRPRGLDTRMAQHLPLLRDLTAAIRKRSVGAWAKQLTMTPAEIRRKREDVLRQVFLGAEEKAATKVAEATAGTGTRAAARHANKKKSAKDANNKPSTARADRRKRGRTETEDVEAEATPSAKKGAAAATVDSTPALSSPATSTVASVSADRAEASSQQTQGATSRPGSRSRTTSRKKSNSAAPTASTLVPPSDVSKRGRGRPRKYPVGTTAPTKPVKAAAAKHGDDKEEEDDEEEEEEIIHWVQCDDCGKWRIIPEPIADTVEFWTCSMRVDPISGHHTSCREMDDEKKMARAGQEVREV